MAMQRDVSALQQGAMETRCLIHGLWATVVCMLGSILMHSVAPADPKLWVAMRIIAGGSAAFRALWSDRKNVTSKEELKETGSALVSNVAPAPVADAPGGSVAQVLGSTCGGCFVGLHRWAWAGVLVCAPSSPLQCSTARYPLIEIFEIC